MRLRALEVERLESTNLRVVERSTFYTGFSFFFIDFYIQILGVALGASALEIGSFTAAVFTAQVFSNPLAGYMADRLGRRWTLSVGGFGRVISLVLVGVAFELSSGTLITIARLVQGLAAGFFWTANSSIVADETEAGGRSQEFGRINNWVNRGMLVGALGGYALLLLRLDLPPYYFAVAAVASGMYALKIRPTGRSKEASSLPVNGPTPLVSVNKRLGIFGLGIVNFLNPAGFLMMSSFLTVYVTQTVFPASVPVSTRAVFIALANAPQVVLSALLSSRIAHIADKRGRFGPLLWSVAATIPVTFALIYIRELWHLAVLGLLLTVTGIALGASFNSIVGDLYRHSRGSVYGALNMVNSVGAALGATLGGILYPLGWTFIIIASVAIQTSSLSGLFFIRKAYR